MKVKIVELFLLLSLCGCAQQKGKDVESKNLESKYLSEKSIPAIKVFFDSIKSGKYAAALNELLKANENINLQDSGTINLQNKFSSLNEASGKFVSERLMRKKELGDDLGVYVYLVKYDKKFYRFTFTFYNNGSAVRIYKFSFDDVIDIELEEALKLYVN